MAGGIVLAQPANFDTSLHKSRAGKDYWYGTANGGFETFTGVPIEDLGCVECHGPTDADGNPYPDPYTPDCNDCHPASFFPVSQDQCLNCHGRQRTEAMALGYSDVHRDSGMVCWDCHSTTDLHGDGTPYNSMLEPGAISADCENCHTTLSPEHPSYDPHGGQVHCTSCHAQTVLSCYNCHFESQIEAHVKRAKQPLHNFVILANRDKDNKVYPMTFQSLTYQGNAFTAFGPFTSHTITLNGRTCTDCHANLGGTIEAIDEYNATGEIKFAEWDDTTKVLTNKMGIVPMPEDYETSFKMDFITYDGDPSDPPGPSTNWSSIGKDTWDGHQMFFATPLSELQMSKLGMTSPVSAVPSSLDHVIFHDVYPNPFNPMTKISFTLNAPANVRVSVYDLKGRLVAQLTDKEYRVGRHTLTWNGLDRAGLAVSSGTYLVQMRSDTDLMTQKISLVR